MKSISKVNSGNELFDFSNLTISMLQCGDEIDWLNG